MKLLTLQEQQKLALNILKYFDAICRQHNIRYTLGGGTLIGAIRHQGFIPWDDDIDIYMARAEYKKFVQVWQSMEHPRYQISLMEDFDGETMGEITKIFDTHTKLIEARHRETKIFMDIFVLDYVPSNPMLLKILMTKYHWINQWTNSAKKRFYLAPQNSIRKKFYDWLSQWLFRKLQSQLEQLHLSYHDKNSDLIGLFAGGYYKEPEKGCMPKSYFESFEYKAFDIEEFLVITKYDQHLRNYYGDYMKLPPIHEQKPGHTIEAYLLK